MLPLRMLRVRLVQKAHADVMLASGISSSVGEHALNKLTVKICSNRSHRRSDRSEIVDRLRPMSGPSASSDIRTFCLGHEGVRVQTPGDADRSTLIGRPSDIYWRTVRHIGVWTSEHFDLVPVKA